MPTERSKAMAERRSRREGEVDGRKQAKSAGQLEEAAGGLKPGWYDKKQAAAYWVCSVRTVERWMSEGMPHAIIAGKAKFKPAEEGDAWLERTGQLERRGGH
jgi:hypothetical protein